MSEQDDDTNSSSAPAAERTEEDVAGGTEPGRDEDVAGETGDGREDAVAGEAGAETVSEIARKPDGDVETALSAIVGEGEDVVIEEDAVTDEETTGSETRSTVEDVTVDDELVEMVEEADAETTARAIQLLRLELEGTEERLAEERDRADDLESRLKRKQADFQNYKKRQKKRKREEIQRATEDLVTRLLDVRDNLLRALEHEDADIRNGVESTLEQFDRQLERENVEPIEPAPGDAVEPQRHEVLATIAADQPEDTIAELHRPGYEMAGKVLRPAQVAVSDGSKHDEADDGNESGDGEKAENDATAGE